MFRDFLYNGFHLQGKTGKTFKNVNKHFGNFVGQNQGKKQKWDEKLITVAYLARVPWVQWHP